MQIHSKHSKRSRCRFRSILFWCLLIGFALVCCSTFSLFLKAQDWTLWLAGAGANTTAFLLVFPLSSFVDEDELLLFSSSASSSSSSSSSSTQQESQDLRTIKSILGCSDDTTNSLESCIIKLNAVRYAAATAGVNVESLETSKKSVHHEKSLQYAMALARDRLAHVDEHHPRPDPIPDDIAILTPYRSREVLPQSEWSETLFPDLNVAGLHKCGTSQLTHILTSHPQVRLFGSVESELFFRPTYQLDYDAKTPEEQLEFQQQLHDFHRDLYVMQKNLTADDPAKKSQLTVASGMIVPDAILRARYLQPKKPMRFLILTRDPADWLWAAWNFWLDTELDAKDADDPARGWANKTLQYRSPELFHELLLGGDRVKSSHWFHRLRSAAIHSPRRFVQAFGRDNVFFARNEDMLPFNVDKPGGLLDRLSAFTGLDRSGFATSAAKSIHNCNGQKGNAAVCNKTSSAYSIAGGRPMLPESRRLVYLFFATECKIWNDEFGIEYPDCLNAIKELK